MQEGIGYVPRLNIKRRLHRKRQGHTLGNSRSRAAVLVDAEPLLVEKASAAKSGFDIPPCRAVWQLGSLPPKNPHTADHIGALNVMTTTGNTSLEVSKSCELPAACLVDFVKVVDDRLIRQSEGISN